MDYMFDHTVLVAEDDPFLPDLEKLYHRPEKGLQYHGILQLRVVPATGAEKFAEFVFNKLNEFVINPKKVGLKESSLNKIKGKNAKFNAKEILKLFKNKNANPYFKDIVLLNTSACLVIADKVKTLKEGIILANKNLINGNALDKLYKLKSFSNE